MFVTYGYKPTYQDVEKFAKCNIELPNINEHNINIDSNIYELFLRNNNKYIPIRYKYNISAEEEFIIIYKNNVNLQTYKKFFIRNKGFILTQEHMEHICAVCSNYAVLNFLVKRGGFVNFKCLINMLDPKKVSNVKLLEYAMLCYQQKFKIDVKK